MNHPADDNVALKTPGQVRALFDELATRYEFADHLFSLGIDSWWRHRAAALLTPAVPGPLLDGATGSGQLAAALARRYPQRRVVGLDFSGGMLRVGRAKFARAGLADRVSFTEGDLRHMPFPADTFAAATISFGIRNVTDRRAALAEFHRVLSSGGRLLVMELSLPTLPVIAPLYDFYFGRVMPAVGGLLRSREAYSYLHASVRAFPPPARFLEMLEEVGFIDCQARALTLGIARIFLGTKP